LSVHDVVQTVSSAATTFGVLTALFVVIRDEHRYRREQRQARGDQARLISVEFDHDHDFQFQFGQRGRNYVFGRVRNFSGRPILDVSFEVPEDYPGSCYLGDEGPLDENNPGTARVVDAGGQLVAVYSVGGLVDWDRFMKVRVFFTDANGVRWSRTEPGPPAEVGGGTPRALPAVAPIDDQLERQGEPDRDGRIPETGSE
jgi:hypothetical protein